MAEIEQLAPAVLREFSTRRRQIEERERALAAAGVDVGDGGREAMRTTRALASATGSTRRSSSSIRSTPSVARIAMVWPYECLVHGGGPP
jgi:hypothetical protein